MAHNPSVAEIWQAVAEWAPSTLAEEWDNVGLQVGDPAAKVRKIVTALDVSQPLVAFAIDTQADIVFTHHPLIFTPLKQLDLSTPIPRVISTLIKHDIALLSAHTNLDSASNGVSDQLAAMLELKDVLPLCPEPSGHDPSAGLGRVGRLPEPLSLRKVSQHVCNRLGLPGVYVTGDPHMVINRVAVCGGSGSSLWPAFVESGAELFVTAEVKHSVAREAEMRELAVMDAGHFATERPIVPILTEYLRSIAVDRQWDVKVLMFKDEKMPASWFVPGAEE